MSSIVNLQEDMNSAYYYGVPGIISSGSIWILAGIVALLHSSNAGIATLIFGGTLIFPISVMLCKSLGRSGKHSKENTSAMLNAQVYIGALTGGAIEFIFQSLFLFKQKI